ncbi:J domain-containing protein [Rhodococcus sp. X156]|uniref:DnaJ C-terminal domain-containing protein n=1 Tax=Rhodococcus sp. X156 TaxID=2499145 RepID=UPI000FD9B696|nr:J domain-containing protein [Rhodococcus sp. X156]
MATDFYQVLGVDRSASTKEIQQAYRRLARQYHPDLNSSPEAEERFKEISEAHEVLTDPKQRARYDRFGPDFRKIPEGMEDAAERARAGAGARGRSGGWTTAGGPAGGTRVHFGGDFGGAEGFDFEDLLGGIFGGARGGGGFAVPGADQEAELELTVLEAYRGGKRHLSLTGNGTREYDVTIPPGVVEGQRIRLAGQGGQGTGDAPAGDLYLVVRLRPDPRYRVNGRDITVTVPLSPAEAALGATVPVETPGGELKVRITPGSSSGRRFRLKGQGMPNARGAPGDLYAEVQIRVPAILTDHERELYEQLATESTFDPRART